MKRRVSFAAAAAALAASLLGGAVTAAPAPTRIQTLEYVGGGIMADDGKHVVVRAGDQVGAVVFRGGPERFVSIEIEDTHGLPVTGIVSQPGGRGTHICGATDEPLKVRPYEKVTVFLMNGVCGDMGASVATAGTVTATFGRG
ncbi:MAG TPA: hypothetical protein VEU29_07570 [Actinomycetota bacterium]|nr:hypothetical protein [Actinomycetota bacterium]